MLAVSTKTGRHPAIKAPGHPDSGSSVQSIRSVEFTGPAGRLEALLNEGNPDAEFAALVCHPHPLGGGTMHNKVVYHTVKVFQSLGLPVLRFNFRGTGLSEGKHHGSAESEDVEAAIDWLTLHYKKPIIAAGFSFGAAMGLAACCGNVAIRGFAALGLPTEAQGRNYRYPMLPICTIPKLFLSGDCDQFAPAEQLRAIAAAAAEPKQLVLVPGADHFFAGSLSLMQEALRRWLRTSFPNLQHDPELHAAGSLTDRESSRGSL